MESKNANESSQTEEEKRFERYKQIVKDKTEGAELEPEGSTEFIQALHEVISDLDKNFVIIAMKVDEDSSMKNYLAVTLMALDQMQKDLGKIIDADMKK